MTVLNLCAHYVGRFKSGSWRNVVFVGLLFQLLLLPISGFAYTNEQKIAAALFNIPIDKIDSSSGANYSYNPWKNNPGSIADNACGYIGGHTGIDMQTKDVAGAATADRNYYAVAPGQVIAIGTDRVGTVAVYDSANDITVLYLHTRTTLVTENTTVKVGNILGIQGDAAFPGAEHVHLETRQGKHVKAACDSNLTLNPVTTITNYLNNSNSNESSIGDMYNDFKGISIANIQTFLEYFGGDLKNKNLGSIYDLDENNFYSEISDWNLPILFNGVFDMSPAEIIYYSAKENNINPVLLLAKIQQEQSLISQTASQHTLNRATGYGIPNSNPSGDPKYKSFLAQLTSLTYQFDKFRGQGLSFREAYDTYTVDNTGQDASYSRFMQIYENYAVLMDDIILGSGGTPVEPPRMSAPSLRFPSDGSANNPISDVDFGWYLKNSENIIDDVRFTLREATAYGGSTGDYVGSCSGSNGKSIGVHSNYSLGQCGDNLKPDQWYKWAVSLSFNNGSKDEGFVGFFKTESLDAAQRPTLLLPVNGSESIEELQYTRFTWNLNNPVSIVDDVQFTLREASGNNGSVGAHVGNCDDLSIGVKEAFYASTCGQQLKAGQWYKWSVALHFNNGLDPINQVAFFKTQSESLGVAQRPTLLLPVNGSESIEELQYTRFTWNLNNPVSIVDDVQFTLREASGNNGSVGAHVGNCDDLSIGVKEAFYASTCGQQLKAGQWYKWSVALHFNNGLDPINQVAFFKTQSESLGVAQRPTLLLPVNGSENTEELIHTRFTWTLDNPVSIVDDVQFTLREAYSNNGSVGAHVGNCDDLSIGVKEAFYASTCGQQLKA
ncbi:MAG: M23 family metallopeptidase, partial [Thiotrichaceae bacterium]|nr:M23 family metallopeptidase [Thiotrichaceae bacterium]